MPDPKIDDIKGRRHYVDEHTFTNRPEAGEHRIGLQTSAEGFW
jgi:hypothetical protein